MSHIAVDPKALVEGERPIFNTSYGKLMMWFFLVSDAFTFSALLITYGSLRVRAVAEGISWANPEHVFTHAPILHEIFHIDAPLVFVGLMTFILILSSVTMVLAVEAGHRNAKDEVFKWVAWTIVGGVAFLSCQAYEWYHFIHGTENGAYELREGALDGINASGLKAGEAVEVFGVKNLEGKVVELRLRNGVSVAKGASVDRVLKGSTHAHGGANLSVNEYGPPAFADLFFFVTGFHGTHVFSGVVLLVILLINVSKGTYERRGHYEMVEKIGLYWHFVDLVWVFVFTFFYLV